LLEETIAASKQTNGETYSFVEEGRDILLPESEHQKIQSNLEEIKSLVPFSDVKIIQGELNLIKGLKLLEVFEGEMNEEAVEEFFDAIPSKRGGIVMGKCTNYEKVRDLLVMFLTMFNCNGFAFEAQKSTIFTTRPFTILSTPLGIHVFLRHRNSRSCAVGRWPCCNRYILKEGSCVLGNITSTGYTLCYSCSRNQEFPIEELFPISAFRDPWDFGSCKRCGVSLSSLASSTSSDFVAERRCDDFEWTWFKAYDRADFYADWMFLPSSSSSKRNFSSIPHGSWINLGLKLLPVDLMRLIVEYHLPLSETSTKHLWVEKDKAVVQCDSLLLRYALFPLNLDSPLDELGFVKCLSLKEK
jgi:hypothetical protein